MSTSDSCDERCMTRRNSVRYVYARFIPNRTRRNRSALVTRMDVRKARAEPNEG